MVRRGENFHITASIGPSWTAPVLRKSKKLVEHKGGCCTCTEFQLQIVSGAFVTLASLRACAFVGRPLTYIWDGWQEAMEV